MIKRSIYQKDNNYKYMYATSEHPIKQKLTELKIKMNNNAQYLGTLIPNTQQ